MTHFATNNRPMPDFFGIPWGSTRDFARTVLDAREGVIFSEEHSGEINQIFGGGLFANKEVKMWVLQFVEDKLHTAKLLIAPPPAQTMHVFRDLVARLTREYGEPAQGNVIVNSPYAEGQELEAIAAGKGIAVSLYVFGQNDVVEGSILCQIAPNGQIVINHQYEELNRHAIASQTGLDAPIDGMPTMQTQSTGGGCFVVTATLANSDHPALFVLRQYRENVLSATPFGRVFILFYGLVGPPLARMIRSHPTLRSAMYRLVVFPVYKNRIARS